ncbi:hypothetical protein KIW84_062546 [Lathyrus oleraceus]|uniref:Uncharacterized protein n=1 Tax=Pisum sativum TaxID=3888 RepID=A0A9D5A8H3_PEA|nr:hypothetical protein KIW84_062546 [Pisum sativum]
MKAAHPHQGCLRPIRPDLPIQSCNSIANSRKYEELQLESKDNDALIELLEDRVTKRQRESKVSSSSSMPQPSVAWKNIVDQLVLEKTQMKASFETEIQRIRRKYAPTSRSSDIVVRDP